MKALLSRLLLIGLIALAAPAAFAIDRDEAAAVAAQATGGRVLAVEAARRDGEPVFLVRVLTPAGEVRIVVVDARTGALR